MSIPLSTINISGSWNKDRDSSALSWPLIHFAAGTDRQKRSLSELVQSVQSLKNKNKKPQSVRYQPPTSVAYYLYPL